MPAERDGAVAPDEIRAGQRLRLLTSARQIVLADHVRLALGPWRRLRGLLGGPPLTTGEALLLRPCNGVHTMFMGYAIDVLFIDRDGRVVHRHAGLRPWRATGLVAGARAAVELPAGSLAAGGVDVGQLVTFVLR